MSKHKTHKTGDLAAELIVQPYGFRLHLTITESIPNAVMRFPELREVVVEESEGLFINKDWDFFIFLKRDLLTNLHISHEVFHCTCRMLDTADCKFDIENHEPWAYLSGYLTDRLYSLIQKQWHLKIR